MAKRLRGTLVGTAVWSLSLLWFLWRIRRPFPSNDEGVTYRDLMRTWSQLGLLWDSGDAPLLPYYAVAKAWSETLHVVLGIPYSIGAVRSLSATAGAFAVTSVYAIVARHRGRVSALFSALALALLPGMSAAAQDARPYALLILGTTLSWITWDRSRESTALLPESARRRRAGHSAQTVYALALALAASIHLYSFLQWPLQLLVACASPGGSLRAPLLLRRRAAGRAARAMGLAGLIVVYPTLAIVSRGTGGAHHEEVTVLGAVKVAAHTVLPMMTRPALPDLALLFFFLVALLEVAREAWARSQADMMASDYLLMVLTWLVGTIGLGFGLALWRPNLMQSRYWLPVIVPISMIMGAGIGGVARAFASSWHKCRPRLLTATLAVILVFALATLLFLLGLPPNVRLREPRGHGTDPRPALQVASTLAREYPGLHVSVLSGADADGVAPVAPEMLSDNLLLVERVDSNYVWPGARSRREVAQMLSDPAPVLVLRGGANQVGWRSPPQVLTSLGYKIVWTRRVSDLWTAIFMERG